MRKVQSATRQAATSPKALITTPFVQAAAGVGALLAHGIFFLATMVGIVWPGRAAGRYRQRCLWLRGDPVQGRARRRAAGYGAAGLDEQPAGSADGRDAEDNLSPGACVRSSRAAAGRALAGGAAAAGRRTEVLKPQVAADLDAVRLALQAHRDRRPRLAGHAGERRPAIPQLGQTGTFVTSPQSADPLKAGVRTAIWGSLWVTLMAFLVAIPLGWAPPSTWKSTAPARAALIRSSKPTSTTWPACRRSSTVCWVWPSLCASLGRSPAAFSLESAILRPPTAARSSPRA